MIQLAHDVYADSNIIINKLSEIKEEIFRSGKMLMVILGGTCGNSSWRETLIKLLNSNIMLYS